MRKGSHHALVHIVVNIQYSMTCQRTFAFIGIPTGPHPFVGSQRVVEGQGGGEQCAI